MRVRLPVVVEVIPRLPVRLRLVPPVIGRPREEPDPPVDVDDDGDLEKERDSAA